MKILRCGFCGAYIVKEMANVRYLSQEEVEAIDAEKLDGVPLGYCPNAQQEHYEQNPEEYL